MNELTEYRKYSFEKRKANFVNFFEEGDRKVAKSVSLIRYLWVIISFVLKKLFYAINYLCYFSSLFRQYQFDADFMEYQIRTKGMDTDEAICFLKKQEIKFKELVYRDKYNEASTVKIAQSFDLLLTTYYAQKGDQAQPYVVKRQADWIITVWNNVIEKKCVFIESKSDFVLVLTGNMPANKIVWSKGLIKLVQFVEEGIEAGKIRNESLTLVGKDQFIMNYILSNFRPNPNIPNQKSEHYAEERIKKAQNERLQIKNKKRITEFFVFD